VLDGIVMSAPTINAPQFNGRAQISGSFTTDQVNDLVTVLKFGSLPLEIEPVGFSSLSATLGLGFLAQPCSRASSVSRSCSRSLLTCTGSGCHRLHRPRLLRGPKTTRCSGPSP